jgi:dUTP pyrophosphatase
MLRIKKLHSDSIVPTLGSSSAAGFDLYLSGRENIVIYPGKQATIPTDIALSIPKGKVGIIKPRSGLALHGIDVLGGVIDSDYRGEVKVILINHGVRTMLFNPGDRIAQLVILYHYNEFEVVESLDDTERGSGGFGSTGR